MVLRVHPSRPFSSQLVLVLIQAIEHTHEDFQTFGHAFCVLNFEVTLVMTMMVASIVEEGCLATVFLNGLHQK